MDYSRCYKALSSITAVIMICGLLYPEEDKRLDYIGESIIQTYTELTSFRANFTQKNYWAEQDLDMTSEGELVFQGEKFSLTYSEPQGQRVIVDGKAYIMDDVEKTVIITDIDEQFLPHLAINHYWGVSEAKLLDSNGVLTIELRPKTEPDIKRIVAVVCSVSYLIREVSYKDYDGNIVRFVFNNIKTDELIADDAFALPELSEFTVIDQTK